MPTLVGSFNPLPGEEGFVLDLQSAQYDRDPYPLLRALRERMPVFGVGRHFCIGAQLARLELATDLGHVLDRLRGLRLERDLDSIPYGGNPAVRGPLQLPIRFDA